MRLPQILHEDDDLIAFDKPPGLPVAAERGRGGKGDAGISLMSLVRERYGDSVANVHRLDTAASGVALCAKTKPALDFLSGQFQGRTALKKYHALVAVLPPERLVTVLAPVRTPAGALPETFTVELSLAEDEHQKGRMHVFGNRGGRPAATEFRVLENFGRFTWVECRALTGRTHQERAHLAVSGAPVLNDAIYGEPEIELRLSDLKRGYKGREDEKPLITRFALHASGLTVRHPVLGTPLTITAPLPHEFEVALKFLRKFVPR